jgi:hypothetical protein
VGIIGADVVTALPIQALEACPDIGLDLFHQVAQMNRAIGIGQGTGYQNVTFIGHVSFGLFATPQRAHNLACLRGLITRKEDN